MNFNETNRELTSSTGYIKCLVDGVVYNYAIYLGIYDDVNNYSEATEEEYNEYLESLEAQEDDDNADQD